MKDFLSFKLSEDFIDSYRDVKPDWGFPIGGGNSLAELTYYTKYSRLKDDGKKERWFETCRRVIEGYYSILKDHCSHNNTTWNENKAQAAAQDAYDRMFSFKWTPPGRGIQHMGTELVNGRKNSGSLQNCAFLTTGLISSRSKSEAIYPFVRLMEMSMYGIGVGFDTDGAGKLTIHEPLCDKKYNFTIPDTREGWAESLGVLLVSYFFINQPVVEFDYSIIRPEGSLIKGFGGVAPGPAPLKRLHESIRELFNNREKTKLTSTDIVDIMNLAGKAVVAGGNRRTAEIALGSLEDKDFLNLKNWEINPDRMSADGWGNLSNNSIRVDSGTNLDSIVDNIVLNGEPGIIYMDTIRKYGRLEDPPNYKNTNAAGVNPCAEQPLFHSECCTLVETYPTRHDSKQDYLRTLKHAYLYGKAVTLLPTSWPDTNEVMQRNRRIGLSMTGLAQFIETKSWNELREWMNDGYSAVVKRDIQYSEWLGVRESIAMTTVKPSGTTGLLGSVTPGVHWPVADIYIRRMRFNKNNILIPILKDAGYHIEPDIMDPDFTVVVELPTAGPEMRTEREVTVWEKIALASMAQRFWSDNAVSCTATFLPEEASQLSSVLRVFDGQLKTMSFLPLFHEDDTYPQQPYSKISRLEYENSVLNIKPLDWNKLYNTSEDVDLNSEKFCTTDKCEVKLF